jgi:hypothetical protein
MNAHRASGMVGCLTTTGGAQRDPYTGVPPFGEREKNMDHDHGNFATCNLSRIF